MGFEVAPEPIGGSRSRGIRIVVVVLAAAAILGIALVTSRGAATNGEPIAAASATEASPRPTAAGPTTGTSSPPNLPAAVIRGLSGPGDVVCHDASPDRCGLIVAAAMKRVRFGAQIEGIGVWTALLCHEVLDCPPSRFVGFRPLGSAIVTYGPGQPAAWVNVVEPLPDPGRDPLAVGPVAWIIRWGP